MSTLEIMQQLDGLMERIDTYDMDGLSEEIVDELQLLIQEANAFMDDKGVMEYENHF